MYICPDITCVLSCTDTQLVYTQCLSHWPCVWFRTLGQPTRQPVIKSQMS